MEALEIIFRGLDVWAIPISKGERQLIATYVSVLNGCEYCYGGHAAAAAEFGISEDLLSALGDDLNSAPVEEKFRPILAYTKKLTQTPSRIIQTDVDNVLNAGWKKLALRHVIAVTARYNFMNRIVDGHGIVADPKNLLIEARATPPRDTCKRARSWAVD